MSHTIRPSGGARTHATHFLPALVLALASCSDQPMAPQAVSAISADSDAAAAAAAASASGVVSVPSSMRSSPFNVTRRLNLPSNFAIAVYARVGGARFMAVTPDNRLLVTVPSSGTIVMLRSNASGGAPIRSNFATGLALPHDMVFHTIGSTTYLYVSEKNKVARYTYHAGDLTAKSRHVVVAGLPDGSLSELHGSYGHELKNIALDRNNKLYVSIGSSCNACTADGHANPVRGAIYQYNADGSGRRLFARGLRNAEGLAVVPGTSTLWAVVNNRDNIAYPNTDHSGNAGRLMQSYVDNHPSEEFTRLRDGGNYGWPYCNPNPSTSSGSVNMPFDRDYEFNRDSHVNCSSMDRVNKGIQAHSAPLGLLFLQNTKFSSSYRGGAVVALHGSWNRSSKTGYKVVWFPWGSSSAPGTQQDLITGWQTGGSYWGRPVDIAVDANGSMFISDDAAGAIYKMTVKG